MTEFTPSPQRNDTRAYNRRDLDSIQQLVNDSSHAMKDALSDIRKDPALGQTKIYPLNAGWEEVDLYYESGHWQEDNPVTLPVNNDC